MMMMIDLIMAIRNSDFPAGFRSMKCAKLTLHVPVNKWSFSRTQHRVTSGSRSAVKCWVRTLITSPTSFVMDKSRKSPHKKLKSTIVALNHTR